MLFYVFHSQEERRAFGGSSFIELQFCKMPISSNIKQKVSTSNIKHWKNDSLYIKDIELFCAQYSLVFGSGIYNNLISGKIDPYGINYFDPKTKNKIIKRMLSEKPLDYEVLVEWLERSEKYNGFYILGV